MNEQQLMLNFKKDHLSTTELGKMSDAAKTYSIEHQGATQRILAALDQQHSLN